MSVRKVYDVLVDGDVVFSGSYKSALVVYDATIRVFAALSLSTADYSILIAFRPN